MTLTASPKGIDLVADIGGTHARLARVEKDVADVRLEAVTKFKSREFASLPEIVTTYCQLTNIPLPARFGLAVAGTVVDDRLISSNLPWANGLEAFSDLLPETDILVLNDYHAAAIGTLNLSDDDCHNLTLVEPDPVGIAVTMGIGTGLGAAIRSGDGANLRVIPTELGQTRLGAHNALELEVLRLLGQANDFVTLERIISGPGLAAAFHAVRKVMGLEHQDVEPANVIQRANSGEQAAISAVQLVITMLANVMADLAVLLNPVGGIFLSGGVTPRLERYLLSQLFQDTLHANEMMRDVIDRIPIILVDRDDVGIIGAAHWMRDLSA